MRTNTWLGLIALNQMTQLLQAGNIAREQKKRDEERDAAFAKAQEAAQRGQFAVWIQTPDGQRFERWSRHALEASRAIDDRQVAWDLAWEQELLERREAARPATLEKVEASTPSVPEEKTRRASRQGFVGFWILFAAVVTIVASLWYGNVSPEHELTAFLVASIALLVAVPALGFTIWRFYVAEARTRRERAIPHYVDEELKRNVVSKAYPWHRRASTERIREIQALISGVVESAPMKYPRNDELVQLAGTYDTRPQHPDEESAPESIQRLLGAFREQDRERLSALERDGIA